MNFGFAIGLRQRHISYESEKKAGVPIAIHDTFSYGVIYIYSIPGGTHKGRLKIGSVTVQGINPTQADIDAAAHARIEQQTKTADIPYTLEHAELALKNDGAKLGSSIIVGGHPL